MTRHISNNFEKFLRQWQQYCRDTSTTDYTPQRFRWYRTTKENLDYTQPEQMAQPYEDAELQADSKRYIAEALMGDVDVDGNPKANRGDAAMLTSENDMLLSAARAFNERHSSKLRHFSHADGVMERVGDPSGALEAIHKQLLSVMTSAAYPRNKP